MLARALGNDHEAADGVALAAWRLAQEHWKHDRKLIPLKTFKLLRAHQELIDVDLAEVRGDAVYVRGSCQYHQWLLDKQEAGRRGGLARVANAKAKASKDQAVASTSLDLLKQNQPSYSYSSSYSKENTEGDSRGELTPTWLALLWNTQCGTLPKLRNEKLQGARLQKARMRLKEYPRGPEWAEAIKRLAKSSFCNGSNPSKEHSNWRADFDFLLQPGKLDQILEGKYDDKGGGGPNAPHPFAKMLQGGSNG